ncbi:MAG: Ppx/GppA family phosphatase [Pseudomonadota bacterium]
MAPAPDGGAAEFDDDAGPFGRPLFDDPQARALSRVGVVDVGSNSIRMVVFDGAARSPAYFFNEKVMAGLGAGLSETGLLNPLGKIRAMDAIKRFKRLADGMGIGPLTAVATAAVREAEDGPAFRQEVLRETGLRLFVIDGPEEARLSAQGVLLGWPGSYGLVCDIGGNSMELAELAEGRVGTCVSSQLGPLRLKTTKGGRKARRAIIDETLAKLHDDLGEQRDRLFLVGGSWRAFARIDMLRKDYPMAVLHEYRMSRSDIVATTKFIASYDLGELRKAAGLSEARIALVPIASEVLTRLVARFKPHDIAVSSYGIREGMLYEQMPQELRDRDPLIEACQFAEHKDARQPGFGRVLYEFVRPLFARAHPDRLRVMKAACLLHDVSWRAHPDYRHEVCFDNATRANLGGLTHAERVYIGVALLHRYKSSREDTRLSELLKLMPEGHLIEAEILGRAMRFGAMFSGNRGADLGTLDWRPKKRILTLKLAEGSKALMGEVAEARFKALASALEAEPVLKER